jgi:hypothetical protein
MEMEASERDGRPHDQGDLRAADPGSVAVVAKKTRGTSAREYVLDVEALALPGENPTELHALLDQWYEVYQPAGVPECYLLETTVYDLFRIRRCRRWLDAAEAKQAVRTGENWRIEQENEVRRLESQLAAAPAATVAELKRSSHGCRWLIDCWERLEWLMERERRASGDEPEPMASHQRREPCSEAFTRKESDDLTRVYRLLAEGKPGERETLAFYIVASQFRDEADGERPAGGDLPARPVCRRRVRAVIERELPPLRQHYDRLKAHSDLPAREQAVRRALARDPDLASVLRTKKQYERMFHENYKMLLEMLKGEPCTSLPPVPVELVLPPDQRSRRGR